MENLIRKSAIYGFFIGIGLGILFVKYKQVIHYNNGVIETSYLPIAEYVITVIKYGVIASLLGLLFGLFLYRKKQQNKLSSLISFVDDYIKKYGLLTLFWFILIFSVIAQVSDQFIMWLSPNAESIWDTRYFYTIVPVLLNYVILSLLKRTTRNKFIISLSRIINTLFFLYYFYCQYIWDAGKWLLF